MLLRDFSAGKRGHGRAPSLKVKLSDLGNSFRVSESGAYHDDFELQTLSYRAPEVLYGLPFDTQIDMWSLGCLLVEVYIGRRLFDAFNRSSAVATMAKTLGPIPRHRFSSGRFYPALSSLPVYGTLSLDDDGKHSSSSYSQPLKPRLATLLHCEDADNHSFVSFLAGCLEYDPRQRLTPLAALRHPFISELCPLAHFLPAEALTPPGAPTVDTHTHTASKAMPGKKWLKVEPASPPSENAAGHALGVALDAGVRASEGGAHASVETGSDVASARSLRRLAAKEACSLSGERLQERALVCPQATHAGSRVSAAAAGRAAEADEDADCNGSSAHALPGDEDSKERAARKKRGRGTGQRGAGGSTGDEHAPRRRPGAAGHARRRVRRASSSSSSEEEEEDADELAEAVAALEHDADEDDGDDGNEYVPTSRGRASPRPRVKARRRAASGAGAGDAAGDGGARDGGTRDETSSQKHSCTDNEAAGSSKSKGASARKHGAEAAGLPQTQAPAGMCNAAGDDASRGRAPAAKRPRNTAGLVGPAARFGAGGEGGGDVDEEAMARRQSRRANIGSKPAEWWVTSANANEGEQRESAPVGSVHGAAAGARGGGRGQGRGGGRGGRDGGGSGSGGGGRAGSVIHSGSSLLF